MQKNTELKLENIKCGGCANMIHSTILQEEKVEEVNVNIETGVVIITHDASLSQDRIISKLTKLGYPIKGHGTSLQKAKSYVSCMIGRIKA